MKTPDYAINNYWLNIIILNQEYKYSIKTLIKKFSSKNIEVRPVWRLNHKQKMF